MLSGRLAGWLPSLACPSDRSLPRHPAACLSCGLRGPGLVWAGAALTLLRPGAWVPFHSTGSAPGLAQHQLGRAAAKSRILGSLWTPRCPRHRDNTHSLTRGATPRTEPPTCPGRPKPIQPRSPNATLTLEATHLQKKISWEVSSKPAREESSRRGPGAPPLPAPLEDKAAGSPYRLLHFGGWRLSHGTSGPHSVFHNLRKGWQRLSRSHLPRSPRQGGEAGRGGTQMQLQVSGSQNNQMRKRRKKPPGQQVTQCPWASSVTWMAAPAPGTAGPSPTCCPRLREGARPGSSGGRGAAGPAARAAGPSVLPRHGAPLLHRAPRPTLGFLH